eukprot:RCo005164
MTSAALPRSKPLGKSPDPFDAECGSDSEMCCQRPSASFDMVEEDLGGLSAPHGRCCDADFDDPDGEFRCFGSLIHPSESVDSDDDQSVPRSSRSSESGPGSELGSEIVEEIREDAECTALHVTPPPIPCRSSIGPGPEERIEGDPECPVAVTTRLFIDHSYSPVPAASSMPLIMALGSPTAEAPGGARSDSEAPVSAEVPSCYSPSASTFNTELDVSRVNIRLSEILGQGRFGRVYMGMREDNGEFLAVKEILLHDLGDHTKTKLASLISEIQIMRPLRHPNIVRYFGTRLVNKTLNIYMELVPGGSLATVLQKFGPLPEPVVRKYTLQIVQGLWYLHQQQIVHRDLKGANILITHKGVLKLADFGSSKQLFDLSDANQYSLSGTAHWMAPEVIKQTGHGTPADIWSLGATVVEMCTGRPPFLDLGSTAIAAMFAIANGEKELDLPDALGPEGKEFLRCCLRREPSQRLSCEQLLSSTWLRGLLPHLTPSANPSPGRVTTTSSSGTGNHPSTHPHPGHPLPPHPPAHTPVPSTTVPTGVVAPSASSSSSSASSASSLTSASASASMPQCANTAAVVSCGEPPARLGSPVRVGPGGSPSLPPIPSAGSLCAVHPLEDAVAPEPSSSCLDTTVDSTHVSSVAESSALAASPGAEEDSTKLPVDDLERSISEFVSQTTWTRVRSSLDVKTQWGLHRRRSLGGGPGGPTPATATTTDRKSAVEGKGVDLGGGRIV